MNVKDTLLAAKEASTRCATASEELRNNALSAMADALRDEVDRILEANKADMADARKAGMKDSLLDRLMLDGNRVFDIADALEELSDLPDPLGQVQDERTIAGGVQMQRISTPMGVVAMVYEARPNVTADAAGICVKSGNACVLRGGSAAHRSNLAIAGVLHEAAVRAGMPQNCILAVEDAERSATDELLRARGLVDLLIPRGGAGLISHCVEYATVPVIETGVGNCHLYVHDPADVAMATEIAVNAKCQRPGVCNAIETLLVDRSIARKALSSILPALFRNGVQYFHTDPISSEIASDLQIPAIVSTEEDWAREYLELEIAVKCVEGLDEAIAHVNTFGTKHSESIVTDDAQAAERFLSEVDAAAVYWNASTRFTDGGQFGLGAEIGISTQKLHARGPFALEALCSYKYVLRGSGQVRA
ncbi:MAG: glutamate-5-semialdehyde dehydrogenase [Eggerthellaceae bacterium]|nr:glutamate-5-semialdehyde dehydrogenase [Eggerthellaceae bacterium]